MIRLLAATLAVACFAMPAFADPPVCSGMGAVADMLASFAEKGDATVTDDVKVKAQTFDEALVVAHQGREFLWFAKGGCIVAPPLYLGDLSVPDAKPKLQGSGLEIGA